MAEARRTLAMLFMVPVLLAATVPSVADQEALETRVGEIFLPYGTPDNPTAAWDQPIFSAETAALIARWREVTPEDEVDALSDGDWLCQCQDWNAAGFTVRFDSLELDEAGAADFDVTVNLGFGGPEFERPERLTFRRENGVWKLDDLFGADFPNGLKQALRETIAEDEALAAE